MKKLAFCALASLVLAPACSGGADDGIDQQLLTEYRASIPSMDQLSVSTPTASQSSAVGDPAIYPASSYDIATGVNGSIADIIETMRFVVMQEPTLYNSATAEFLWGPYESDDGMGTVAAYIVEAGPLEDFQYHYALLRGTDNDVDGMTPVIWGGATPNPNNDDHGAGITMWDFEADYQFRTDNGLDTTDVPRGRFIAVYGKEPGQNGEEVTMAVAAFRNFMPGDDPVAEPVDLDYLYGRVEADGNTLDFLDWQANLDVDDDPARPAAEDVGVRMAFLNEGVGRAESHAMNGDLDVGQTAIGVECWDASLNQSYLMFEASTDGNVDFTVSDGDPADCGLFQDDLTTLGIPALEDVPAELTDALDRAAEFGIPN